MKTKFSFFTAEKILWMLHGQVFIMKKSRERINEGHTAFSATLSVTLLFGIIDPKK